MWKQRCQKLVDKRVAVLIATTQVQTNDEESTDVAAYFRSFQRLKHKVCVCKTLEATTKDYIDSVSYKANKARWFAEHIIVH